MHSQQSQVLQRFVVGKPDIYIDAWSGIQLGKLKALLYNHRLVWVGSDLKDHLFPTFLPWAGTPSELNVSKWRAGKLLTPTVHCQAPGREKALNPKQCFITQGNAEKPSVVGLPYLCRKASLSPNLPWKLLMDCKSGIRAVSASGCSLLFSGHQRSLCVKLWPLEQMRSLLTRQDTRWRADPIEVQQTCHQGLQQPLGWDQIFTDLYLTDTTLKLCSGA